MLTWLPISKLSKRVYWIGSKQLYACTILKNDHNPYHKVSFKRHWHKNKRNNNKYTTNMSYRLTPTNHNHWMVDYRGLGHTGTYRMRYCKKCMHVSVLNFLLTCCIGVTAQNMNKLYTSIESASSAQSITNILNTKDTQKKHMSILAVLEI